MKGVRNLTLAEVCAGIEDPRADRVCKFELRELLFVAMSTVLMGATTYVMMAKYAHERIRWLQRFMPFENGAPCAGTLRGVLGALDPRQVHEAFTKWMRGSLEELRGVGVIAMDGKAAKGTRTDDKKPLHVVTAFMSAADAALAQIACEDKSNEITALAALLNMLDVHGCLVTIDAIGTQREIASLVAARKADFLLSVKGNQPNLFEKVRDAFEVLPTDVDPEGGNYAATVSRGHGRRETRECFVVRGRGWMGAEAGKWPDVRYAACIRAMTESKAGVTESCRYYIGSQKEEDASAETILESRRSHWQVEQFHWILDVAFREDASRAHSDHAAENLNVMRQIACNVLRTTPGLERSVPLSQASCLLNNEVFNKVIERMGFAQAS